MFLRAVKHIDVKLMTSISRPVSCAFEIIKDGKIDLILRSLIL
jgi:hypothetical protein